MKGSAPIEQIDRRYKKRAVKLLSAPKVTMPKIKKVKAIRSLIRGQ